MARIISNLRASNEPTVALEPEVQRAEALYYRLRTQHEQAKAERIKQWFIRHPSAKDFAPTQEEIRQDTTVNEWVFTFIDELRYSGEQRYQRAKNPAHGFGHEPKPEGIHPWSEGLSSIKCVPGCRYYESTGTIGTLEVLSWFEGYDKYDEVLSIWTEPREEAPTQ